MELPVGPRHTASSAGTPTAGLQGPGQAPRDPLPRPARRAGGWPPTLFAFGGPGKPESKHPGSAELLLLSRLISQGPGATEHVPPPTHTEGAQGQVNMPAREIS